MRQQDHAGMIADEAARWFLRLQDVAATPQTFREWQWWLNAAPEHRHMYEQMEETALRVSRVPTDPALPSADEMARDTYDGSVPLLAWKQRANAEISSGKRMHWSKLAVAAALACTTIAGGWLWMERARFARLDMNSHHTAPGERRVVELPDGSRVTLDADSALDTQFTATRRLLTLERGEAYFQVAKESDRTFVVQAGSAQVTAIGTAFNVRISEDRTVVAVTEGKVVFAVTPRISSTSPADPEQHLPSVRVSGTRPRLVAQVAAGEAVMYADEGNLQALPAHEAPLATTWLDGRRQYREEPLKYVLADLDRYTDRPIELADAQAGELQFTGTLNLQNSEAWLRGLSVALPVSVTKLPDGALLVRSLPAE